MKETHEALNRIEESKKLKKSSEELKLENKAAEGGRKRLLKKRKRNFKLRLKRHYSSDKCKMFALETMIMEVVKNSIVGDDVKEFLKTKMDSNDLLEVISENLSNSTLELNLETNNPIAKDIIEGGKKINESILQRKLDKLEEAKSGEDIKEIDEEPLLSSDEEEEAANIFDKIDSDYDVAKVIEDRVSSVIKKEQELKDKANEETKQIKDKVKKTDEVGGLAESLMVGIMKRLVQETDEPDLDKAFQETVFKLTLIETLNTVGLIEMDKLKLRKLKEYYKFDY